MINEYKNCATFYSYVYSLLFQKRSLIINNGLGNKYYRM